MIRTPLNAGWRASRAAGLFEALTDPAPVREVHLPHDMLRHEARTPEGASHTGYHPSLAVQYTRDLEVPESARDERRVLELDGVYRDAMVYVNGELAGQRADGYTRFHVPLDPYLRYGETNELRIVSRTHQDSRWYTGVGVHREVHMLIGPLVHVAVDGVVVTTPDVEDGQAVVAVAATVRNDSATTRTVMVRTRLTGPDGTEVATDRAPITLLPQEEGTARQRMLVRDPVRWDVDTPHLYTARVELLDDASSADVHSGRPTDIASTTFGIRTLQLDTVNGLRINGRTVKLRGACIHHDNGLLGSAAVRRAEERRVERLKAAGFNAIRSSHNPMSTAMLDACDRLGMLVMDEAFDVWTAAKTMHDYSLRFGAWAEQDVEAMVRKDMNHPSVILYSIGNEIPETGTGIGAGRGRRLAERIRTLDPTRFVTNGINPAISIMAEVHARDEAPAGAEVNDMGDDFADVGASPLATERTAESFAALDVAGMNYAESRYASDAGLFPHRVIVGTETLPAQIADNWAMVRRLDHVIGDFTWTGWDYLGEAGIGRVSYGEGPHPLGASYPWRAAWCGDIDITGRRRPMSHYREIVFGLEDGPYIAVQRPQHHGQAQTRTPWSWSDSVSSWSWAVEPGSPAVVEVYSAAAEIELLVNGRSRGRRPAGPDHRFLATFETTWEPGELTAVAWEHGTEIGRQTLRTAGEPLRLAARPDRDVLVADDGDLAHVDITLEDGDGVLATHRSAVVTVEVAGAGVLEGLGSADPATEERFDGAAVATFDGHALAIVRPSGPGEIDVTVTASGYESARVRLRADAPGSTTDVGRRHPQR